MAQSIWTLWQPDDLFAKLFSEVGPRLSIFLCLLLFFFLPYMVTVNCSSATATERDTCAGKKLLFEFHSCSKCPFSRMLISSADYYLRVSVSSPCVLLSAQRTHVHCCHTLYGSALFFRYLATLHFLSFPGSLSGPRRLLFLPTLPQSPLPVFTPPPLSFQFHSSQPSHCIRDERHSSFSLSLSLLYLQRTDCTATAAFFCPK